MGSQNGRFRRQPRRELTQLEVLKEQEREYHLSLLRITPPSTHWPEMFFALYSLLFHLGKLVCDALLIKQFMEDGYNASAYGIIGCYAIEALIHIIYEYAHRGRLYLWLVDIMQLRIVVEFFVYLYDWVRLYGDRWINSAFRSDVGYESFFGSLPSLAIQVCTPASLLAIAYASPRFSLLHVLLS